jgi:hypothetical protein
MTWNFPTIPDVFNVIECVLTGHSWNEEGVCTTCGAKKAAK